MMRLFDKENNIFSRESNMNIKKLFTTNFYKNNNREYKERIKKDYLINQEFRGGGFPITTEFSSIEVVITLPSNIKKFRTN